MNMYKSAAPWVVGALAAGFAWALHIPLFLALLVGAVTSGVYFAVVALLGGSSPSSTLPADIQRLRERALGAITEIDELTLRAPNIDGASVRTQAHAVLAEFDRTSQTVVSLDRAIGRIDLNELRHDASRVDYDLRGAHGETRRTLTESRRQIQSQIEVHERLSNMRASHMQTLHSSVIGLDGIVARVAELEALDASSGQVDLTQTRLGEVGDNLEALRRGFADSDRSARELLEGM